MAKLKTIILASGSATRMRPLSINRAKCMQWILGRPLLEYLVRDLHASGLDDLILSTRGRAGEVEDFFGDGTKYGVHISYHECESWRGTAGTARHLVDEEGKDADTFLVIYGDSLLCADFSALWQDHQKNNADCTVLVHHPDFSAFLYEPGDPIILDDAPRTNYGVLEAAQDGRILRIVEKPRLDELNTFTNPVANAAVYILRREIFEQIPQDVLFDFPRDLFGRLIADQRSCHAFDIGSGYRLDLGTLQNYYTAQMMILEEKLPFEFPFPKTSEGMWRGEDTTIDPSSRLQPPLLFGSRSRVAADVLLANSIIGSNVEIDTGACVRHSIVLDGARIGAGAQVVESIVGDHSVVGEDAVVPPHSVLGSLCRLGGDSLRVDSSQFLGMVHAERKERKYDPR